MNGRPGANTSTAELLQFTMARYVRISLQGMHITKQSDQNSVRWTGDLQALEKRSFYSIRFIRIGGRCICSGHAEKCITENDSVELPKCECLHNTCGNKCEKCCPMYNQLAYQLGGLNNQNSCEKCECNGHANECRYSSEVDQRNGSINTIGIMSGGGVCIDCSVSLKKTPIFNLIKRLMFYFRNLQLE